MFNKPRNTYNVVGNQVYVKSVPKVSPITLEIQTTSGEKGCAGLKLHTLHHTSFRLTKQKGENTSTVIAIAETIFKPLLRRESHSDSKEDIKQDNKEFMG